jgi:hypothetical protein
MRTGQHQLANSTWVVAQRLEPDKAQSIDHAILAMLMDIREELRAITGRLDCSETLSIPALLRRISANTHKPKRRLKKVSA